MGKFFGKIGFASTAEVEPGIWEENPILEKPYFGDTGKNWNIRRTNNSDSINDNIDVENNISIIADTYAFLNFKNIIYVEWMGVKWKAESVEVERPRLLITLGGVYNG